MSMDLDDIKYGTTVDGEYMEVETVDKCMRMLRYRFDDQKRTVNNLRNKIKELTDSQYKDKKLREMKDKLEAMQREYNRGFPITDKEWDAIETWKEKHDREVHSLIECNERIGGAIGGRYTFEFIPCSIGTIGTIRCGDCGEKFTFRELM
mgnify:CR=1 FL=1